MTAVRGESQVKETQLNQEEQMEFGWKVLESCTDFSKHFDFKPASMIAIAGGLAAYTADRLKTGPKAMPSGPVELNEAWTTWGSTFLLGLVALCLLVTFLQILSAVSPTAAATFNGLFPWQHRGCDPEATSLIYFHDVARIAHPAGDGSPKPELWANRVKAMTHADLLRDLADQVVENAAIAKRKTERLRLAASWLMLGLMVTGVQVAYAIFIPLLVRK